MNYLKISISLILLFICLTTFSQICNHTNLSGQFDIKVSAVKINNTVTGSDSCLATIILLEKKSKKIIQKIKVGSTHFSENVFKDCSFVQSYQTKMNHAFDVVDNNYGDLIVADFNFDGKDDFAVIKDSGGNGGPLYDFYIQGKEKRFFRDEFLSDTMGCSRLILAKNQKYSKLRFMQTPAR